MRTLALQLLLGRISCQQRRMLPQQRLQQVPLGSQEGTFRLPICCSRRQAGMAALQQGQLLTRLVQLRVGQWGSSRVA